jgi:chaperone required for assembly of F1-ATPase
MKRFYKEVAAAPAGAGFEIHLDGKPIRTPGRAVLTVPTLELAEAIVKEWSAVKENIEPSMMPVTGIAYAAIDYVPHNRTEVVDKVARYAETDLVSYRAEAPRKLQEFQTNAYQPMVDWLEERFGVRLAITEGVIPVAQDPAHMATIRDVIEGIDDLRLAALQEITTASGSVVIALALWDNAIEPDMAWRVAQVEEDFQIGFWGDDPNLMIMREGRRQAMTAGAAVLSCLNP